MKTPAASTLQDKIVIDAAAAGKITLSGINATVSDTIEVKNGANVKFELNKENNIDSIKLGANAKVSFEGTGTLKANTFTSDGTNDMTFKSGAIMVSSGTGTITAGNVVVDSAFIGAAISASNPVKNSAGKAVKSISLPWNDKLSDFSGGNITSLTIDGTPHKMNIPHGQQGNLWFDPASVHRVTFTGVAGGKTVTKSLAVQDNNGTLTWIEPDIPFTVIGGTKDTDWTYDANTNTLKVLKNTELTISGGKLTEADGSTTIGRIAIADNIATDPAQALKLNLNGIECVMKDNASAMSLGNGNYVSLNITDDSTNTLTSGASHAGISIGNDTHLTITGNTGVLNATGGTYGAGTGRGGTSTTDMDASITIKGGMIRAIGGSYGAGIGGAEYAKVGNIEITNGEITAKSNGHGAGIGGGWSSSATNGTIDIHGGRITALSLQHGTGIGSGCQGTSEKITIDGTAVIVSALGGNDGAGIGASWRGTCKGIEISDDAEVLLAKGGNNGAGIGAGSSGSKASNITIQKFDEQGNPIKDANGAYVYETIPAILIDTDKSVTAQGGESGVGIGSGYSNSSVGDIFIKKGTVSAVGGTDSTGIGAGRSSTGGNITIGDPDDDTAKVIVSASGGMNHNGGNIISYTDSKHTEGKEGKLIITGKNTSVRPGEVGEGLYSTSGAVDKNGDPLYAYPLYLFQVPAGQSPLADGGTLKTYGYPLSLPEDAKNIQILVDGTPLQRDLSHKPLNDHHTFIWMSGTNHTLTITYDTDAATGQTANLSLVFYADSGTFRATGQAKPEPAKKPTYSTDPPPESVESDTTRPVVPSKPVPPPKPMPEPVPPPQYGKGLILQIGANTGEILEIPLFYLSCESMQLNALNISTQENAWKSMPIIKNAINRISEIRGSYGAYMNRLEHNRADLSQAVEHLTEAESRIRDTDVAEEMMEYTKTNILLQSAQAMLAQANQMPEGVLQLFQ